MFENLYTSKKVVLYLFRRELNTEKTYTFILCIVQYTYTRAYTRAYTQAYTPRAEYRKEYKGGEHVTARGREVYRLFVPPPHHSLSLFLSVSQWSNQKCLSDTCFRKTLLLLCCLSLCFLNLSAGFICHFFPNASVDLLKYGISWAGKHWRVWTFFFLFLGTRSRAIFRASFSLAKGIVFGILWWSAQVTVDTQTEMPEVSPSWV